MNENKKPIATIVSSYKLSEDELRELKSRVSNLDSFQLKFKIDRQIIAGVIIQTDSTMIDLSLQSEINKLHKIVYETN